MVEYFPTIRQPRERTFDYGSNFSSRHPITKNAIKENSLNNSTQRQMKRIDT